MEKYFLYRCISLLFPIEVKEFHGREINAVQTTATMKAGSTLKAAI